MRIYRGFHHTLTTETALTVGNFDGCHRGHKALLERLRAVARAEGRQAAVMTFEPHPREFFSPATAPARLTPLREKLAYFAAAGVDAVFVIPFNPRFAALSAETFIHVVLIEALRVHHLIIGDDFRFGSDRRGDFGVLEAAARDTGLTVEATPTVVFPDSGERISSSAIRAALAAGDCAKAAAFLGHPYAVAGRVVHGRRLGRQLGFPTANLYLRHTPLPLTGIFAISAEFAGARFAGVANVGLRPTVETGVVRPLLEAHLFDFDGNLYGKQLSVRFIRKLRDEQKFSGLEALQQQIALDVAQARAACVSSEA
ncbi:MAG: bifunctional riboflavin kinase/FAD synthetase [Zoogloeaceae bacterium]|jgi:riboflavin kinase/FMN adenylyltransferase|nr:bifunctional riboflavin kinase/FAD synthetase [Zoogloeaceae bacterium]